MEYHEIQRLWDDTFQRFLFFFGESVAGMAALGSVCHEPINLNDRGGCQVGGDH